MQTPRDAFPPPQVKQALKVMMASVHMQVTHACQVGSWGLMAQRLLAGPLASEARAAEEMPGWACSMRAASTACCTRAGVL